MTHVCKTSTMDKPYMTHVRTIHNGLTMHNPSVHTIHNK